MLPVTIVIFLLGKQVCNDGRGAPAFVASAGNGGHGGGGDHDGAPARSLGRAALDTAGLDAPPSKLAVQPWFAMVDRRGGSRPRRTTRPNAAQSWPPEYSV